MSVPSASVKDRVMGDIGKAVEILYNLDIYLSNGYDGNPKSSTTKKINGVRRPVRRAMDNLRSEKWIKYL